jgi:hypothetical protein
MGLETISMMGSLRAWSNGIPRLPRACAGKMMDARTRTRLTTARHIPHSWSHESEKNKKKKKQKGEAGLFKANSL